MRGSWYCSARCFTAAVEKEILRLLSSGKESANHVSRMPLGLNLVSHGLLTVEQLREAASKQKEAGEEIGEVLVRNGTVTEKQVTAIRAADWGCPVFAVPKHPVRIRMDVPSTLIRLYLMIPLHYVEATNLLLIGFVQSVDYGLLYTIEQMTGCTTKPCFVTPSDFQLQMRHREQAQTPPQEAPSKEVKSDDIKTPAEIAQAICASGLDTEADEALLSKCNEYIWARLKTGSETADFLFKVREPLPDGPKNSPRRVDKSSPRADRDTAGGKSAQPRDQPANRS
jgi:Type II secretion system (T2SS), protein E, N-terminal domain